MGISKKEALQAIEREREMICAASDAVWDHPETAFQEFKSTEILCELLEKEGFSVERNLAGIQTAFSGRFGHGKPVVGILGEFDALSRSRRALKRCLYVRGSRATAAAITCWEPDLWLRPLP